MVRRITQIQKHLLLAGLVCLLALPGWSQKKYPTLRAALGAGLGGSNGPRSVNWINNGETFSYIEGRGVIKSFSPKNQKEAVVFSSKEMKFPGTSRQFRYSSFEFSKDSKYLLFKTNFRPVWRRSGIADYYFYSIQNKTLKLVAKDAQTAQLSPDGKKVGYERKGDMFVYDFATKKETRLTNDGDEKNFLYNGRFGWAYEEEFGLAQAWVWSPDSKYIAFWQTDEREVPVFQMTDYSTTHKEWIKIKYPQVGDKNPIVKIGVLDVVAKNRQWMDLSLNDGYVPRLYWTSNSGELAIVHMNRAQTHLQLFFHNAKTGKGKKVMEEKSKAWIDVFDFFAGVNHLFFFPEGSKEFFWISDRDGWSHLYRYDYNGKLLNQVTKGKWEVTNVYNVDVKRKTIFYASTENNPTERHLYSVDFKGKRKKQLTKVAGRHFINFSPNSKYYIDRYSNVNTPTQVALWSTKGKKIKDLETNERVKKQTASGYAKKELMSFKASDGQKVDIYVIKPMNFDKNKQYPLVVNIYGGPGSQGVYNQFASNGWEQYLAQEGFVVINVNNRGSGGYGSKFEKVVYKNLGHNEAKDFAGAAKFMATMPWVDGNKIAIRGHSYGGYMASFTQLNYPEIFKVAIVTAPVTDWRLYDSIYTERYMGLLSDNNEGYVNSSVSKYAKRIPGKMLLSHSTMDENVHVQNTFQLMKAMTDKGQDVDLRIYPPGAHGVAYNGASYVLLYSLYVDYLKEHLMGVGSK
ncbi:MAG TPA: S9 family peptidase [Microscillaceae bacterium]|nr:S9 family peptidase [Microscillaceae bacterium]